MKTATVWINRAQGKIWIQAPARFQVGSGKQYIFVKSESRQEKSILILDENLFTRTLHTTDFSY